MGGRAGHCGFVKTTGGLYVVALPASAKSASIHGLSVKDLFFQASVAKVEKLPDGRLTWKFISVRTHVVDEARVALLEGGSISGESVYTVGKGAGPKSSRGGYHWLAEKLSPEIQESPTGTRHLFALGSFSDKEFEEALARSPGGSGLLLLDPNEATPKPMLLPSSPF